MIGGPWTSHRGRPCHVCGSTREPGDKLGTGAMRPWRGFKPVGAAARAERAYVCEGCLQGAARWLSTLSDGVALAMLHSARLGRIDLMTRPARQDRGFTRPGGAGAGEGGSSRSIVNSIRRRAASDRVGKSSCIRRQLSILRMSLADRARFNRWSSVSGIHGYAAMGVIASTPQRAVDRWLRITAMCG